MKKNIYFITGASSDIGVNYIKKLNAKCQTPGIVIAHYAKDSSFLEKIIPDLNHIQVIPVQADLSIREDVNNLTNYILDKYGSPTHMLHLAAQKFEYMKIKNLDWRLIQSDLEIQVHSLAEFFKAFLPVMGKNKFGRVVVMLSSYTQGVPPKNLTNYLIVKYALLGLMKGAAKEYESKGICINGISPEMIETKFLSNIDSRIIQMNAEVSSMKRNIKIEEVIAAIEYLMSESAGYMSGINLNMSGGKYM